MNVPPGGAGLANYDGAVLDAVVVGGGIAGLASAWDLRNRDILVLEASDRLGGRIRSEARDPYWLNLGAHVFSGPGSATGRLCADVGVEVASVPGQLAAVELNGRLVVGGRPELYPLRLALAASERLALAKAGVRLRLAVARYSKAAAAREGESAPQARRRLLQFGDDRTFADWLGPMPGDADALFRATVTRSTAEPEEISAGQGIGYFALVWAAGGGLSRNIVGGAGVLVDGIAAELGEKVVTGCEVTEVAPGEDSVTVSYTRDGKAEQVTARQAVVATRAFEAAAIVARAARRHAARAGGDPVRADGGDGGADRRAGADAVGRHLRAGDAEAQLQHAVQHRKRGARAAGTPALGRQPDDVPLGARRRCRCWSCRTTRWSGRSCSTSTTCSRRRAGTCARRSC